MSVSIQRENAAVVPGGWRVATSTADTAAWLSSRAPTSKSSAASSASPTTTLICHQPGPMSATMRSPTATPTLTPTASSTERRSRLVTPTPRTRTQAIGAKNGTGWPNRSRATR